MKITFLAPGYVRHPSGGLRIVYEYANRLVARGHQVTIVHPRRLKYWGNYGQTSVYRWLRGKATDCNNLLSRPKIDWHEIDKRVELSFVPTSATRYMPNADAVFATAWSTVKSVLEYPASKGSKCYLIQGYETFQGPKQIVDETWRAPLHKVVIAKWLVDLGKELGADDLTLIPNAIAHNVYRLINPVTARSQQVAMLYSKAAVKGSEYGIAALNIVKRRFPELKAVLFGTCPRQPSIPDWIEYHYNPKQRVIIEHIYNTSAIFLSSSLSEGFPLPPAEAAACGCALVATDIGGFREYISHGKTGLLSAPTDVDGLVRNMSLLLGDSRRRVALATAAGIHVRTFTWPRSTDLLEDFIKGCCNARNAQSVLC